MAPAERVHHNEFVIVKTLDKASTNLF